ncbi:hypothetical protein FOA52_004651 [Chlamydomonas sp. UWO 241]|nr:hypothetical protein FOA52_004651 [Chlamydomonas sp. UWO 241]
MHVPCTCAYMCTRSLHPPSIFPSTRVTASEQPEQGISTRRTTWVHNPRQKRAGVPPKNDGPGFPKEC